MRGNIVSAARFPAGVHVSVGGAAPKGVDFLTRAYGFFPWLVLMALALTYLVLARAFRSLLLPLKAVLLNLLSVAASYGLLVAIFRFGVGADLLGVQRSAQIEGWIPVFLFATLFGLSMDYEVFLVSRMRESWDRHHDNVEAVAFGLERTGRLDHGRRRGDGRFVRRLRRRQRPGAPAVRARPRARGPDRRDADPRAARAVAHGDHGQLELVAAVARPVAPSRARLEEALDEA